MSYVSLSRIEKFIKCPYSYKLSYIDNLDVLPSQDPQDARIIGSALHYGCETRDLDKALQMYYDNYYVMDNLQINEAMKLSNLIPKVWEVIDNLGYSNAEHEYEFEVDGLKGIVDFMGCNPDGSVDIYDFKYSNAVERYMESPQLHLYKYYLEKLGFNVGKMGFIFIPKTMIRQKKTESIDTFRMRLKGTLETMTPNVVMVEYNPLKVADALAEAVNLYNTDTFELNPSKLCDWCDFKKYCQKGEDYMIIPKNERKEVSINRNPDIWIYGASYVGKTSFVDQLDDTLILNTDGNVDTITSPVIEIRDIVTKEGRTTKRKYAWEVLKETIEELEADTHGFKNLAIDLAEDLRELCRLYMYAKNGWEHEQDGGYGKGYDMVTLEYNATMKRLKNIKGLRLIIISKETTKEVTRGTRTITTYAPNIKKETAEILAGIVDMTVHVTIEEDGQRYMHLKKSPYVFGGSRFDFKEDKIELSVAALDKAILEAGINTNYEKEIAEQVKNQDVAKEESGESLTPNVTSEETSNVEEVPKPRRRRKTEDN